MTKIPCFVCIVGFLVSSAATEDGGPNHWRQLAKDNVNMYLKLKPNTLKAKNIVLMLGDGMGISTITAARILKGQMRNKPGEEEELNFEKFPYTALSKVYTVDSQVPDSAATMTAIVTGVKTKNRVLGVDERATPVECQDLTNYSLSNIRHWCEEAGKSSGIVTTSRVTHATPAALYAVTSNRDWESSNSISTNSDVVCTDIASQLVYNASNIRVILGGGSKHFIPNDTVDPTTGIIDSQRQRFDGNNLLQAWKNEKKKRNASHQVVHNTQQLQGVNTESTDYLFGLFSNDHMSYETDRDSGPTGEPSLSEMTRKAIEILSRNQQGFFLMVEGARIDHANHEVRAKKALVDTLAFDEAVQTVMDMTDEKETLIIVTADHSHTLTISGYPERGNDILGLSRGVDGTLQLGLDGLPYTTLMYANGPYEEHPRPNLTNVDTMNKTFQHNTIVERGSETHSGEDVSIYARGPMAHLLTGVKEQHIIAYVMAHAACVGDIGISCDKGRGKESDCEYNTNDSRQNRSPMFMSNIILFNLISLSLPYLPMII